MGCEGITPGKNGPCRLQVIFIVHDWSLMSVNGKAHSIKRLTMAEVNIWHARYAQR
jgi:hypothetical protein